MEGSYGALCTSDGEYFEGDTRRYSNCIHKVPFDMSRYLTVTSRRPLGKSAVLYRTKDTQKFIYKVMSYLKFENGCFQAPLPLALRPHARHRESQNRYNRKSKNTKERWVK